MSVLNSNSVNTIDVSNNLANEINSNDTTRISENRRPANEHFKSKVATTIKPTTTSNTNIVTATTIPIHQTTTTTVTVSATPVAVVSTMPAATNPMSATVTVLNSNTPFPSVSSDQCSDSEEDFDRTTKNLGAHKWIFNYKDVSSVNSHRSFYSEWKTRITNFTVVFNVYVYDFVFMLHCEISHLICI